MDRTTSFDAGSFSAVYRHTAGVPRRINLLCSRLLLQAYLNESDEITSADVEQVARESDIDHRPDLERVCRGTRRPAQNPR